MKKLSGLIFRIFKKSRNWKDIEYFNPQWKERIFLMSKFIENESSVLDLGCGKMWLKEFLGEDVKYYPVDYKSRGESSIICDFNKYEYPAIGAQVSFISGCLEYVIDYKWFISSIKSDKCILSYCTIENFPDINDRRSKTWVNDLSINDIITLFEDNNYYLSDKKDGLNTIFVFKKVEVSV